MEAWQIIALTGFLIIIMARLFIFGGSRPPEKEWIQAMDEAFVHFSAEMEAENQQIIGHISSFKNRYEQEMQVLTGKVSALEARCEALNKELQHFRQVPTPAPAAEFAPPPEAKAAGTDIRSRYREVFAMYDEGKSIDHIAKKTGMNKGEIQLIITLANKEELSRA